MKQAALVTGTSSGIGQDIARNLAARGFDLILVARRKQRLLELAQQLKDEHGSECLILACDLTAREQLNSIFEQAGSWLAQNRNLTVLVNNAGAGVWANFQQQELAITQRDVDLNVIALTTLSRQFIDVATAHQQPAYILNVASLAGILPTPRYAVYSATKAYVMRISEIIAYELKGSNIQISCVCPGGVLTEFIDNSGQKLKGNLGMMQSKKVADMAVAAMFKGKLFLIPGLLNKFSALARFLPRFMRLAAIERSMLITVEDNGKGNG